MTTDHIFRHTWRTVARWDICWAPLFVVFFLPLTVVNAFAFSVGLAPPWLNADFSVPAIILASGKTLRRPALIAGLLALILAMFGQVAHFSFYLFFVNYKQLLRFLWYISAWPTHLLMTGGSITAGYLFVVLLVCMKFRQTRSHAAYFILPLLVMFALDVTFSANFVLRKDVTRMPNLVTSPLLPIALSLRSSISEQPTRWSSPIPTYDGLTKLTSIPQGTITPADFVLSLEVESLGLPKRAELREMEERIITQSFPGYRLVESAKEPFSGGTITGELRSLCNLNDPSGTEVSPNRRTDLLTECVPAHAKRNGWYTIAIHGNSGSFFNRADLYPHLGFQSAIFFEDMVAHSALKRCALVFNGICDESTATELMELIAKRPASEPIFAHFMTLDTHFPLASRYFKKDVSLCDAAMPGVVCLYFSAVKFSLQSIGRGIGYSSRRPTSIVVYGDHAPPFLSGDAKALFDYTSVPVYFLAEDGPHQ